MATIGNITSAGGPAGALSAYGSANSASKPRGSLSAPESARSDSAEASPTAAPPNALAPVHSTIVRGALVDGDDPSQRIASAVTDALLRRIYGETPNAAESAQDSSETMDGLY